MRPIYGTLLAQSVDTNYVSYEVLADEAPKMYAVLFDGKPFNLRKRYLAVDRANRYVRLSYPTPSFAHSLARQLNRRFKTDRFTVGVSTGWVDINTL